MRPPSPGGRQPGAWRACPAGTCRAPWPAHGRASLPLGSSLLGDLGHGRTERAGPGAALRGALGALVATRVGTPAGVFAGVVADHLARDEGVPAQGCLV